MPAFNVVTYKDPSFTALWNRVYERTGQKMKAYVAVQRKLLMIIYTLWKKEQPYQLKYERRKEDTQNQYWINIEPEFSLEKKQPRTARLH